MNEMIFDSATRHSAALFPMHFYLSRSLIFRYCCFTPSPLAVYANAVPLNLTSRVYARLRFVRHMRIRPCAYKLRGGRLQLNMG